MSRAPIFCRLSHNASIMAEGTRLRIYGGNATLGAQTEATFDIDYAYAPIEAMVQLDEGIVHILTAREVLALHSHEPHAENFQIFQRWLR